MSPIKNCVQRGVDKPFDPENVTNLSNGSENTKNPRNDQIKL